MITHKSFHFVGDDGRVIRVATASAMHGLRSRGPGVVVACAGDIRAGALTVASRVGDSTQTDDAAFSAIRRTHARTRITQGRGNVINSIIS